ncbi:MAG: hypothetical protein JWM12_3099 [Ilumatobacteraceae bacterium]|nr:hypothetical protein [Ilumatobacteraceae bacterium]
MGASATFEAGQLGAAPLAVDPGGHISVVLRVRNNGSLPDELTLEAMGAAAPWMEIEPSTLTLPPDGEASATVHFRPPRSAAAMPGETPFGVQVTSREDPDHSVAGEGVVQVGRFDQRVVTMTPAAASAPARARFELTVDNRGNFPTRVSFAALDPQRECRFRFAPPVVDIGAGAARQIRLEVIAKRFWRGLPKAHHFQVQVIEDEREMEVLEGTFVQEETIPSWVGKALLALAAAVVLGVVLWFALVRPAVRDAAREAVQRPLASMSSRVDQVLDTTTTLPPTTTTLPGFDTSYGSPTDFQLGGVAPAGSTQTFTHTFDTDFAMTDILLQNPGGDSGAVTLMRNGDVLQTNALENFRDYDLHTVAPHVFTAGESLVMTVICATPGPSNVSGCAISGSFVGFAK